MPSYTLKFEFFGRRMQTTITAPDEAQARQKLAERISIHSVEKLPPPKSEFDDLTNEMLDVLGLKRK